MVLHFTSTATAVQVTYSQKPNVKLQT